MKKSLSVFEKVGKKRRQGQVTCQEGALYLRSTDLYQLYHLASICTSKGLCTQVLRLYQRSIDLSLLSTEKEVLIPSLITPLQAGEALEQQQKNRERVFAFFFPSFPRH